MFDQYVATQVETTNHKTVAMLANHGVAAEVSPLNTGYSIITIDPEAQDTNVVADALSAGYFGPQRSFPFDFDYDFRTAYTNFKKNHPTINFSTFYLIRRHVDVHHSIFG